MGNNLAYFVFLSITQKIRFITVTPGWSWRVSQMSNKLGRPWGRRRRWSIYGWFRLRSLDL